MTEQVHLNDIGTDFRITVKEAGAVVDISAASALAVIMEKPDGASVEFAASLFTDGSDGILHYQTGSGDIDQLGEWSYRGKVTFSATLVFYTIDPETFDVIQ